MGQSAFEVPLRCTVLFYAKRGAKAFQLSRCPAPGANEGNKQKKDKETGSNSLTSFYLTD
jgi:hypothetical protein